MIHGGAFLFYGTDSVSDSLAADVCFYGNGYRLDSDLNMVCVALCDPASALRQIIGYRFRSSFKMPEFACPPLIWNH